MSVDPRGFILQSTSPLSGANLVAQSNMSLAALASLSASTAAPTFGPGSTNNLVEGQLWLDTSQTQRVLRRWDGASWAIAQRFKLTQNTTFFVRPDGNDLNYGFANDSTHAFLTGQGALNFLKANLDGGGFRSFINFSSGTYNGTLFLEGGIPGLPGSSGLTITGSSLVTLTSTSSTATIMGRSPDCKFMIDGGIKIENTGVGDGVFVLHGANVNLGFVTWGAAGNAHVQAHDNGIAEWFQTSSEYITAPAPLHAYSNGGEMTYKFMTVTPTSTINFSIAFAYADNLGRLYAFSNTINSSTLITGQKGFARYNSLLQTFGQSTTALPGNSTAGTSNGGILA